MSSSASKAVAYLALLQIAVLLFGVGVSSVNVSFCEQHGGRVRLPWQYRGMYDYWYLVLAVPLAWVLLSVALARVVRNQAVVVPASVSVGVIAFMVLLSWTIVTLAGLVHV